MRFVRRVIVLFLPLAAVVVVVAVLRGAGVPLTVPGVVVAVILLFAVRITTGWLRRRRRSLPVRPPRRPR